MRRLALAVACLAVTAAPASAAWKEYKYADLGVAKEFPADPKVTDGEYKTQAAGTAPAKIFTVEQDNAIYRMTVADLRGKADQGASIMGECTFLAEDAGNPVQNMTARINRVYGRLQSTDLPDGSRAMTECLFTAGRLYKIEAIILPTNDDFPTSPQAIRFVNSVDFNMRGEGAPRPAGGAAAPRGEPGE
jgi:hypothetical protein